MIRIGEIIDALRRRWSPIAQPDPVLAVYQRRRVLGERDDFERELSSWESRRRGRSSGGRRKSR